MKKLIISILILLMPIVSFAGGRDTAGLPLTGGTLQGSVDWDGYDITGVDSITGESLQLAENEILLNGTSVSFHLNTIVEDGYLHIGDGGTVRHASGDGSLFVESILDVDAAPFFRVGANLYRIGAAVTLDLARVDAGITDTSHFAKINFQMGASSTTCAQIVGEAEGTAENAAELVFLTKTAAGALTERLRIEDDGETHLQGGYLHIGNAGTPDIADGDGDLFIEDELEVDGYIDIIESEIIIITSMTINMILNMNGHDIVDVDSYDGQSLNIAESDFTSNSSSTCHHHPTEHNGRYEFGSISAPPINNAKIGSTYFDTDTNTQMISTSALNGILGSGWVECLCSVAGDGGNKNEQMVSKAGSAVFPAANAAEPEKVGTNRNKWVLKYDKNTDESAEWDEFVHYEYDGGAIVFEIIWYSTAVAAGQEVVWNVQFSTSQTGGDSDDAYSNTYTTTTITANAANLDQRSIISIATPASFVANADLGIRVTRDADHADDTLTGDAYLKKDITKFDKN